MPSKLDGLFKRYEQLKDQRKNYDALLQELAEYFLPRKGDFSAALTPGQEENRENIFDSTPEESLHLLAAAMNGLVTNPAMKWFDLRLRGYFGTVEKDASEWLDVASSVMLDVLSSESSGFQQAVHEFYLDYAAFGTACMYSEEDLSGNVMRFWSVPLSCVYFAENSNGIVDTVFYRQEMTARQILQDWPKSATEKVRELIRNDKPDEKVAVIHAVMPRRERDQKKRDKLNKPFASVYFIEGEKEVLSESGYDEMPYHVARWTKAAGEVMGRGPGHMALPDVRVLNAMSRTEMMGAEKQADPPVIVPDDGFTGPVRTGPGALLYERPGGTGQIRPLVTGIDLQSTELMITRKQEAIKRIFLNDKLSIEKNAEMTATETMIRREDQMRVLGPVLGRLQTEFLSPLINRTFQVIMRQDVLPQPPDSLRDKSLVVEYVSPIARSQKQYESQALMQAIQYMAPFIQVDPGLMDNFDADEIIRDSQVLFGYPSKYLRGADEVAQMREQRAQAAQLAQQLEAAKSAASTAKDLGKVKTDEANAATALMGAQ